MISQRFLTNPPIQKRLARPVPTNTATSLAQEETIGAMNSSDSDIEVLRPERMVSVKLNAFCNWYEHNHCEVLLCEPMEPVHVKVTV
jgi:hypothetical protein